MQQNICKCYLCKKNALIYFENYYPYPSLPNSVGVLVLHLRFNLALVKLDVRFNTWDCGNGEDPSCQGSYIQGSSKLLHTQSLHFMETKSWYKGKLIFQSFTIACNEQWRWQSTLMINRWQVLTSLAQFWEGWDWKMNFLCMESLHFLWICVSKLFIIVSHHWFQDNKNY